MTHSGSRLPGRPDERAASRQPSSAPGGCADPLMGVLLVVAEAAAGALLVLWLAVRGLTRSREATGGKVSAPPPADPGTDWTPVVVAAVLALLVACVAVGLLRGGWYWSGGMQVVVALTLGVGVLSFLVEGGGQEPPAPEPAPTWSSPPCLSGGDSDECARSGG
ncbi:DUF6234 family protein [Streptomyces rubiginosohelvolus]|uniref:DUF6234 family protein n=1 Tax=Streptomyces rubiginosohelvolus TaxID=67362 RepID=UPI00364DBD48